MSYTVRLESRAEQQLKALAPDLLRRVDVKLRGLAVNPRPKGVKKLQGQTGEGWRLRIGDHRILYTIDDAHRMVSVFRIAARSKVYRRKWRRR